MNLRYFKDQIQKYIKENPKDSAYKNRWNSFIQNLKSEVKEKIKYGKKMKILDEKALNFKKKNLKIYNKQDFSIISNLEEFNKFIVYFTGFNKTLYDNYKLNEIYRQEFKFNYFNAVLDLLINNFGEDDSKIDAFFEELKI